MVVEKQGDMECALSTMGALSGVPLASVRISAQALAKQERSSFFRHGVLRKVAMSLDPTGELLALCGGWGFPLKNTGTVRHLSKRIRVLPKKGKGVVRIVPRSARLLGGHIAPWSDGLIYDPGDPMVGITLRQFRQRAHVDYITFKASK